MVIVNEKIFEGFRNKIRDKNTSSEDLQKILKKLGMEISNRIIEKYFISDRHIVTPIGESCFGSYICVPKVAVITTKDDYSYFGAGFIDSFENVVSGYMDFNGRRGAEALSSPIRNLVLPDASNVDTLIIAKSVLATGCTAIALAKKAVEKYNPRLVIFASVFYSNQGVMEINNEFKNADFFLFGEADNIRKDGMLIPGIGDIDKRLSSIA